MLQNGFHRIFLIVLLTSFWGCSSGQDKTTQSSDQAASAESAAEEIWTFRYEATAEGKAQLTVAVAPEGVALGTFSGTVREGEDRYVGTWVDDRTGERQHAELILESDGSVRYVFDNRDLPQGMPSTFVLEGSWEEESGSEDLISVRWRRMH